MKDLIKNMSKDISNFEIGKIFKEISNEDINENFLGVFPSDKINKFIMFQKISNTNRSNAADTHWWSILSI